MPSSTKQFLDKIFKTKPDDQLILLWQLDDHRSAWFTDTSYAADYVELNPNDIYFGVGTSSKDFGPSKRCPQNAISGIPGFYVDIDVKDSKAHKSKKYPESLGEALSLVLGHNFDPTVIINSGYGLHCYWLFEEMWMFENDVDRFSAKMMSKRMNNMIKNRALSIDRDIDSIFDLSRILRPPGSFNCKKKKPVEVKIHTIDGRRYTPQFIDDNISKEPTPDSFELSPPPDQIQKDLLTQGSAQPKSSGPSGSLQSKQPQGSSKLILNPDAKPNLKKLEELNNIFGNFSATWDNLRDDLPSASEYDLSLANFCAQLNMSDQDIADMLITFRRRHDLKPEKSTRKTYMADTIMKAKKKSGNKAARELSRLSLTKDTEYEDPNHHQKLVNAINVKLKKIKLKKLIKEIYGPNPADIRYLMEIEIKINGKNELKTIRAQNDFIDSPIKFRKTIQNAPGVNKRITISNRDWNDFSQCMSDVVIEDYVGNTTITERMTAWIEEYIAKHSDKNLFADCFDSREPFKEGMSWFIFIESFQNFVYNKDFEMTDKELKSYLKNQGFRSTRKRTTPPGRGQISRGVWKVPNNTYAI